MAGRRAGGQWAKSWEGTIPVNGFQGWNWEKSEFGLSYHFLLIGCLETQSIRVVKSEALEC